MASFGGDRYELGTLVAQTPWNTVFRARDLTTGRHVALKILHGLFPDDPEELLRRHRSVDALRAIEHPVIARHITLDRWNDTYYLVEEFCQGIPLAKAIDSVSWSVPMAVELVAQVADALRVCHSHDVFHLGVKPGNIVVLAPRGGSFPRDPCDLEVRLLGVGEALLVPHLEGRQPRENIVYRSPEQIGFLEQKPTGPSDLYSLGVVFYRLLTGALPYDGDLASIRQLMAKGAPLPPRRLNPELPGTLDALVLRMLARIPDERFPSLEEFVIELRSLQRTLPRETRQSTEEDLQLLVSFEHHLQLTERDLELTKLSSHFDQAVLGRGGFVRVTGETGSGKTRLLEELRAHVLTSHGLFLWCQATEFESNRPFSPLREGVRQFVQHIDGLPERSRILVHKRIEAAVGNFGKELLKAIPESQRLLPGTPELIALEPERERQRSTKTLLKLFLAIGGPGLPVVLFIDDYQRVDAGTRDLVDKLRQSISTAHLVIICAETVGDGFSPLATSADEADADEAIHIHLNPLSLAGCRQLFEAGFSCENSLAKDLATVAYERCGGNPRVLVDLIKTLSPEIDTASSSETSLLKLQTLLPEAGEENLAGRRWSDLSETSRQVVSVASVIGRKFAPDLLEEVSRASRPDVLRAVAEGLEQQVLASWTVLGEEWHCFANEQIHEEVYSAISARERLRIHREIAEALTREAEDDDSAVYEIALHYLRGENPGRAFRAVVRAADAAKKAYANREAIYFFSGALEILPDQEGALMLELLEDLGDVCALDGQYERAKSSYQRVLEVLDDPVHKARLEGKIGDMYFRRGMNESAIDHLTRALAWIGLRSPRSRLGLGWSILRNTVVQALHTLTPKRLLTLNNRKVRDIGREAVKIFHALAYANYFLDLPRTLEVHLRQLNLAERLGDSLELAHTYSAHGIVCSLIPLHGRANRYQLAGLEIREQFGDRWGVGQSYAFLGVCSYYRSNLPLAIEYLRKSVNILESTGDQWEIEAAYSHLAFCFVLQGNVDAAEEMSRMLLKLSQEIHDLKFVAISQTTLAECELIRGNLDQALSLTGKALETAGDNFTEAMAMRVRGQVLLRLDRRQEALEVLEGSLALIRKHRLMNEYLVANHIAYAHALLSDVDTILAMDIRSRRKYLARSNQHIRKGVRLARRFRNHLGYALRVRALYHCFRGSAARAESSFAQSERVLMEHGRVYELALTQLARARWKLRAGKLKDAEELNKVVEVFRKVGARLDVEESRALSKLPGTAGATQRNLRSQRQQLSSLFKVSRAISSILELDLLSVQITDLAVEITGGEKAYLFLRGGNRRPEVRCGRGLDKKEISIQLTSDELALVSRAWNSGVTQVVATTELTENAPSREGSVICVPLRIKERTFGLIYVENSLSTDLYTEDDLEFIGIFASQAAISLQNAFSYQKIEELYLSLERKVRERTRELLENKRKLEEANRLKSEFLANMSHELRTPLNAVIAMSEILLERTFGELNEKQEVYLKHILESGVHLLSLINDVLNLSKVEAGQLHLELDLVDLHEWIQASLVVVRERAIKHDISLRFEPGTEDALVQGDARRLKQVLINLLSNAVKFTPDGGQVTVRTSKDAAGVIVCVEDTGIGIAPEDQLIVFEEFRQVDSSYSRRYEGSGLGLALCKKFIELHGGKIWLESEEGKGSKFYFCLPPHENPAISRTPVASGADQHVEATE